LPQFEPRRQARSGRSGQAAWRTKHQDRAGEAAKLRPKSALWPGTQGSVQRLGSDCLAVVEAFKARGVSLFLLDLNGGADDVSGNGIARLFLTIVSAFAEFERDRIGERSSRCPSSRRRCGASASCTPMA
jgi:hypothetical protein